MSPRSRAIEILAAAGLGDQQLERERQRGQLAAENAKAWASLPSSLIPLLGQGIGAYQGQVQNEANTAAEQVAAEHIGDTGTQVEGPAMPGQERVYAETPAQVAAKALAANKTLTPDKPTGFFDSLGALIGNRDAAAAKARAAATAKIAGTVDTNRTEGDKLARQSWQDEQARADKAAALALEQKKVDVSALKPGEELDKKMFDLVKAKQGHLVPDDWWDEHFPGVAKPKAPPPNPAAGLHTQVEQETLTKLRRENAQNANGQPLVEGARKDIAGLQAQLAQIDSVAAQKGAIDTGMLSGLQNSIAQFMGIDDPTKTKFRAQISSLRDDLLHDLSGAAISPSEMGRLMEGLPSFTDNDSAFVAKLAAVRAKRDALLKARLDVEGKSGANVTGIGTPSGLSITPRGTATPTTADPFADIP